LPEIAEEPARNTPPQYEIVDGLNKLHEKEITYITLWLTKAHAYPEGPRSGSRPSKKIDKNPRDAKRGLTRDMILVKTISSQII